jgi:hypothetical protein
MLCETVSILSYFTDCKSDMQIGSCRDCYMLSVVVVKEPSITIIIQYRDEIRTCVQICRDNLKIFVYIQFPEILRHVTAG